MNKTEYPSDVDWNKVIHSWQEAYGLDETGPPVWVPGPAVWVLAGAMLFVLGIIIGALMW